MDLAALGESYRALRPRLDKIAGQLEAHLRDIVKSAGVKGANISSRVKDTDSFLKKAWQRSLSGDPWEDPIGQCTDKVGCRVDVVYLADVLSLTGAIEADETLQVQKVDDKAVALGPNTLGYGGVHIDALLRGFQEERDLCEIQLRTHAQAAWAMASHELSYKGPLGTTEEQLRKLNRLTALVELFDEVVDQVSTEIMESPGYPLSLLLHRLESLWLTHVGRAYNDELTSTVLRILFDEMDRAEASELSDAISGFVADHHQQILDAVNASADDPLLTQPETLLILYFLEEDKFGFVERWVQKGFDWKLLDEAALKLGVRLPQPS